MRIRDDVVAFIDETALPDFIYHYNFISIEREEAIGRLMIQNLSLAAMGVFITLVLFSDPVNSVFVVLCIVMVDANILALMVLWDVKVNIASVVNLVMAVGEH